MIRERKVRHQNELRCLVSRGTIFAEAKQTTVIDWPLTSEWSVYHAVVSYQTVESITHRQCMYSTGHLWRHSRLLTCVIAIDSREFACVRSGVKNLLIMFPRNALMFWEIQCYLSIFLQCDVIRSRGSCTSVITMFSGATKQYTA